MSKWYKLFLPIILTGTFDCLSMEEKIGNTTNLYPNLKIQKETQYDYRQLIKNQNKARTRIRKRSKIKQEQYFSKPFIPSNNKQNRTNSPLKQRSHHKSRINSFFDARTKCECVLIGVGICLSSVIGFIIGLKLAEHRKREKA